MKKFKISVPATTANLGPGYDTCGIALNLYNSFTFSFEKPGINFINVQDRFAHNDNLVYQTFCSILEKHNYPIPENFVLEVETNIPIARGLGSSSTCIVAGIMAANEYASLNLSINEMLLEACAMEGHPDNVAPALLGNLVGAVIVNDDVVAQEIEVPEDFIFYAFVEPNEVETSLARAVLPKSLSYSDAIFNISRCSLLLRAFEHRMIDQLQLLIDDRLHEQYRLKLVKSYDILEDIINHDLFVANWVSGAGSTLMALGTNDFEEKIDNLVKAKLPEEIQIYKLNACENGAKIEYV